MTDNHKNRRITIAEGLIGQISALDKVKIDQRRGFIHDQLMAAIDDICETHKDGSRQALTRSQVNVIKDVAFQIVYILDTKNHPPSSLIRRLYSALRKGPIGEKITIIAGIITIILGVISIADYTVGLVKGRLEERSVAPAAASNPPNSG